MQARMLLVPFPPAPHKEVPHPNIHIYLLMKKTIYDDFHAMTMQQPCIQFQPQVKLLIGTWYFSSHNNLGI